MCVTAAVRKVASKQDCTPWHKHKISPLQTVWKSLNVPLTETVYCSQLWGTLRFSDGKDKTCHSAMCITAAVREVASKQDCTPWPAFLLDLSSHLNPNPRTNIQQKSQDSRNLYFRTVKIKLAIVQCALLQQCAKWQVSKIVRPDPPFS